jgi:hypothetical protein
LLLLLSWRQDLCYVVQANLEQELLPSIRNSHFWSLGQVWWCKAVIPATWEAEIRTIKVGGQPKQKAKDKLK